MDTIRQSAQIDVTLFNLQSTIFSWDSGSPGQFKTSLVGGENVPNLNRVFAAVSNQHYVGNNQLTKPGVILLDRFVQSGIESSIS